MDQPEPYFMKNPEWYYHDEEQWKYVLTDKATDKARESYEEFYDASDRVNTFPELEDFE